MNKHIAKFLSVLSVSMLVLSMAPTAVYAAPGDGTDTVVTADEGDPGLVFIEDVQTKNSTETPYQVNVNMKMPDNFGLTGYVILSNGTDLYRASCSSDNDYTSRLYLPAGTYTVDDMGVYNDNVGEYTFTSDVKEFSLSAHHDMQSVVATIDNLTELSAQGQARMDEVEKAKAEAEAVSNGTAATDAASSDKENAENTDIFANKLTPVGQGADDTNFYATALDDAYIGADGDVYYPVKSTSEKGFMTAHGNATGAYDIVIKVTKGGVIGEAVMAISLDGGQSLAGQSTIDETVKLSSIGMAFDFTTVNDTDEFKEGEEFTLHTYETFETTSSNPEYADVIVSGHPLEKSVPQITVLSTGKRGVSKFSLTMTEGGQPVLTDLIPENGIYEYGDLTFYFTDSVFQKGDTFKATVTPNEEKDNTAAIVILLCVLLGIVIIVFAYLLSKVENKNVYKLRPYKQKQDDSKYM